MGKIIDGQDVCYVPVMDVIRVWNNAEITNASLREWHQKSKMADQIAILNFANLEVLRNQDVLMQEKKNKDKFEKEMYDIQTKVITSYKTSVITSLGEFYFVFGRRGQYSEADGLHPIEFESPVMFGNKFYDELSKI